MEKLKGKTILIGKEPGQGRLMVTVAGSGRQAVIGAVGCVPNSVSRCKPAEGVAHAGIVIDANGTMVVKNLKPMNITYVNGRETVSKRIETADTLELGKDHFRVNLQAVLETADKLLGGQMPNGGGGNGGNGGGGNGGNGGGGQGGRTFNIAHLEMVWDGYHDELRVLREKQKRTNLIRTGCSIFTMCAMPCIFLFGPVGYLLTLIGIIGSVYSFVGLKNDNTTDEQERITEKFQDHYVCPNPECNKFLGNLSYKLMKRQYSMHCPYCKSEFVEKR